MRREILTAFAAIGAIVSVGISVAFRVHGMPNDVFFFLGLALFWVWILGPD